MERVDQLKIVVPTEDGLSTKEVMVGMDPSTVATKTEVATALASKTDTTVTETLIGRLTALENEPDVDLSSYATTAAMTAADTALSNRITALEDEPEIDLSPYATTTAMNTAISTAVSTLETAHDARLDAIEADYVTSTELSTAIGNISLASIKGRVDTEGDLPTTNNKNGDIYLVGASDATILSEYIYFEELGRFEEFGSFASSDLDLSDYATITSMNTAISTAVSTLETAHDTRLDTLEADVAALETSSITSATVNGEAVTVTSGNLDIVVGTTTFTIEEDVDSGTSIGVITFG